MSILFSQLTLWNLWGLLPVWPVLTVVIALQARPWTYPDGSIPNLGYWDRPTPCRWTMAIGQIRMALDTHHILTFLMPIPLGLVKRMPSGYPSCSTLWAFLYVQSWFGQTRHLTPAGKIAKGFTPAGQDILQPAVTTHSVWHALHPYTQL